MAVPGYPHNALALAVGVTAVALAALVVRAAPTRGVNRLLATILALEGVAIGASGLYALGEGDRPLLETVNAALFIVLFFIAYPRLLATLATPLAAPFRAGWGRSITLAVATVLFVANLAIGAVHAGAVASATWTPLLEDAFSGLFIVGFLTVGIYALMAAVSAYRRTTVGSAARAQAGAFAAAFGTRDALWVLHVLAFIVIAPIYGESSSPSQALWTWGPPLYTLVYLPLLAYGILRTQLFDVDLRIKWTIQRSTLVTIFLVVFFVVAKVAEFYLNKTFGYALGGVAAGLLLFLAPRLNKMADKVADTAMPKVANTSQYVAFKKMEVYRAAIESTLEGGEITEKERQTLDRLRAKLGIGAEDAQAIERDVREAPGGAALT